MRAALLVLVAALSTACANGFAAPTPLPPPPGVVVPAPLPPLTAFQQTSACPETTVGVDLAFYRQIGCNAFELPLQPVRRWLVAPTVYLRTVDEFGRAMDVLTLDTVQQALTASAPGWTGGRFTLRVERGTETRDSVPGYLTVKWLTAGLTGWCGRSISGSDGGAIEFNAGSATCGCDGSRIRPSIAAHELGHAFGYWHTGNAADLMSGLPNPSCTQQPSTRELAAAAYQYR